MQGVLQDELLVFEDYAIILVIDQIAYVLAIFDFMFFEGGFQRCEMGSVLSHISRKDKAGGTLSEDFEFLTGETFQEIEFILV